MIERTVEPCSGNITAPSGGVDGGDLFDDWRGRFVKISFRRLFSLKSDDDVHVSRAVVDPNTPSG